MVKLTYTGVVRIVLTVQWRVNITRTETCQKDLLFEECLRQWWLHVVPVTRRVKEVCIVVTARRWWTRSLCISSFSMHLSVEKTCLDAGSHIEEMTLTEHLIVHTYFVMRQMLDLSQNWILDLLYSWILDLLYSWILDLLYSLSLSWILFTTQFYCRLQLIAHRFQYWLSLVWWSINMNTVSQSSVWMLPRFSVVEGRDTHLSLATLMYCTVILHVAMLQLPTVVFHSWWYVYQQDFS